MLNTNTLARPYAKAAFEYASKEQATDAWTSMLNLSSALVADERVVTVLGNPELGKDKKVAFLLQMCEGNVNESFINYLTVLGENGRLSLLPTIATLYGDFVAESNRSLEVEVQTAFELSAEQLQTLAAALSKRLDRTVQPKATVNPALLGGLHIRAGDLVIDGSIRGKLDKLAEALKS